MAKIIRTLNLPEELWVEIKKKAEEEYTSINGYILRAINSAIRGTVVQGPKKERGRPKKEKVKVDAPTMPLPPVDLRSDFQKKAARATWLREELKWATQARDEYLEQEPDNPLAPYILDEQKKIDAYQAELDNLTSTLGTFKEV